MAAKASKVDKASKRVAFVTGAGRGIGRAIALALADKGHALVVGARSRDQIESLAKEIQSMQGAVLPVLLDVTQESSITKAVSIAQKEFGQIDILINNAGTAKSAPILKTELSLWNELIELNLTGTFLCTKAVLGGMMERGWGRVVNIASVAGKVGAPYISAYTASKHGVIGLTRALAAELAEKGVTVNAICPGYVNTPLTDKNIQNIVDRTGRSAKDTRSFLEGLSPQKRMIEPEEVAALALYLCSEEASGINGQAINLDGGAVQS